MIPSPILPLLLSTGLAYAQPHLHKRAGPPAFFLAGDSTTATGGGWGDAFVSDLTCGSTGENYGDSGATTGSFRSDGYWDEVLAAVESHSADYTPYVTIQFGHNDQKTDAGLDAFLDNLVQFDADVRAAGGTPIFLTSLSRRNFGDDGTVTDDLANVRGLTIQAAEQTGALWADLNVASREYLNAIGEENAHTYNLAEDDNTHLNEEGGVVFAGIVGIMLKELNAEFGQYIAIDADLVAAVEAGEYYYPDL
ncbi:rhamnogalacturonan acetylesterase [Aspergillus undulatus]|uniref:rhamnogalacturonan acetylesterase n=1 Tax=Aspergillus undulatus TaxID=1810928 RepID=UPI003CCE45EE